MNLCWYSVPLFLFLSHFSSLLSCGSCGGRRGRELHSKTIETQCYSETEGEGDTLSLLGRCVVVSTSIYWMMKTTFSDGYLGSRNDEERSEMRYVMRIAEFSESSNLWTQIALPGTPGSMLVWVSVNTTHLFVFVVCGVSLSLSLFWGKKGKPSDSGWEMDDWDVLDCTKSMSLWVCVLVTGVELFFNRKSFHTQALVKNLRNVSSYAFLGFSSLDQAW